MPPTEEARRKQLCDHLGREALALRGAAGAAHQVLLPWLTPWHGTAPGDMTTTLYRFFCNGISLMLFFNITYESIKKHVQRFLMFF